MTLFSNYEYFVCKWLLKTIFTAYLRSFRHGDVIFAELGVRRS